MKSIIVLNGEPPLKQSLEQWWRQVDLRICADGAADTCVSYDLAPDVVLGDFDSVSERSRKELNQTRFVSAPDQEKTDGEKSIEFALAAGSTEIEIFGALGRRIDHELYNLGLLKRFLNSGANIRLYSNSERLFLINQSTTIRGKPGSLISMIPIFGPVQGVSCVGLAYPLDRATLEMGGRCSISNQFVEDSAEITVTSGELLIIQPI